MADSLLAQRLATYSDPTHANSIFHQPFTYVHGKEVWSVAISGPGLVALKGTSSYIRLTSPSAMVPTLLGTQPYDQVEIHTEGFLTWTTPLDEEEKYGTVCGILIDLRRLRKILDLQPFPKMQVWDASHVVGLPTLAMKVGNHWRGFLAGDDVHTPKNTRAWVPPFVPKLVPPPVVVPEIPAALLPLPQDALSMMDDMEE